MSQNEHITFAIEPIDPKTLRQILGTPPTLEDIESLIARQGDKEQEFVKVVRCQNCAKAKDCCQEIMLRDGTGRILYYCSYGEEK